ncbi:MAG: toprim domain-containing protein [Lachnospiraceae bacterium]|nr:toprim domain-containing protein [Lachnospiraceae bacterium]
MKNTENEYYSFIKEQISIKDILDKLGIATKNSGDDFICSCIYHNDPNPSMHIYSATNTFYCFECKRGGNGFTIIKEKLNCDFHKSIQWLENAYPWLLEEKPIVKNQSLLKPVRNAFQIAYEVYKKMDYKEEAGLLAFAKNREYEAEFLSNRDIFFAFGKKLHSVYVEHEEQYVEEMELLKEASLLRPLPRRRNDIKTHYEDFCRDDRIIFTLRDERSEIVGFAGRSLKEKTSYKYLFTKKLPKSKLLYRFDDVLKQVAKDKDNNTIYIVEGMFDALRLEEKGYLAVAVMGSQLTEKQVRLLKMAASRARTRLSFNIFLDSDEAGLKGAVASIRRIWKCEALCGHNVWVSVLKEYKDPDEVFQDGRKEMAIRYTAFEFLMRYHMADIGKYIVGQEVKERILSIDLQEEFKEIGIDARFGLYAGIEDLLTEKEWNTVFEKYNAVFGATEKENKSNEEFAYVKLREFIIGKNEDKNSGYSAEKRKQTEEREKDYQYRMQIALQIARTGYAREEISLDDSTWDRIALSADIVYGYFYRILQEQKSIDIPMITMQLPKKLGEQRTKSLYCHEELILQQYVMNELLSRGSDENFEKCIPAVRYEEQRGIYLTGYGMEGVEEPVSFAYQIDMSVINGEAEIKNGMFRPFQDKMLQDMQNFGTYTALYQRESRYLRTPILLVPACTTRAVDYYVFGQGFYLSAGLKTVFCNGVGTGGRGGSCFIGQDSWDEKSI